MLFNYARIDADLVQKTQYKIPPNKTADPPRSLGHSLNFVFLSTATESSSTDWWALIDNLRAQVDGLGDIVAGFNTSMYLQNRQRRCRRCRTALTLFDCFGAVNLRLVSYNLSSF